MDRMIMNERPARAVSTPSRGQRVALVDLLDRLLAGGVVITGDITISIAEVDLVRISLRALIASIRPEMERVIGDERDAVPSPEPVRATVIREDTDL